MTTLNTTELFKTIDLKIEALKDEKRRMLKAADLVFQEHATEVKITEGPDRGYVKARWADLNEKNRYDGLITEFQNIGGVIRQLKKHKMNLLKIETELNEIL